VQRRGARPEALLAGGTFWLVGVPAVAFPFVFAAWPFVLKLGGCNAGCAPFDESSRAAVLVAAVLLGAFAALVGLFIFTRRRPAIGYPLFATVGVAILMGAFAFAVAEGQLLLIPIVLSWPGWTGIAFVTAAHRARQPAGPTPVWRPW
jgi:hypothetical protein